MFSNIDFGFVNWSVSNIVLFSSERMRLKISVRKSNDNKANTPARTDKSIVFDKWIREANLSIFPDGSQFDMKRRADIYENPNVSNIDTIFKTRGEFRNLEKTLLIYTDIKRQLSNKQPKWLTIVLRYGISARKNTILIKGRVYCFLNI